MKARAEFNALPRGLKQQLMEKTGRGIEAIEEEYVEEAARLTLAGRPDGPEKKDEAMRNLMARLAQGKR
jgi:hypothetical protein